MLALDQDGNGNVIPSGLGPELLATGPLWPFKPPELDDHMVLGSAPVPELMGGNQRFIYELHPNGLDHRWATGQPGLHHAFQNISPDVIAAAQQGRALIVINASWEAHDFVSQDLSAALSRGAVLRGLDPRGVLVLTSNLSRRARSLHHGMHQVCFFEHFMARARHRQPWAFATANQQLAHPQRRARFLCFNRRAHAHRQVLLAGMLQHGLLSRGLVSLPAPETPDLAWRSIPPELGADENSIQQLRARAPLVIDTVDFVPNHARTHPREPYLGTWFSVVTETLFHDVGSAREFVSEKTFKPMANHHPFLLVSLPGTLQVLRRLGYRTFAPMFNEDYDHEPDPSTRIRMVLAEVARLSALPDDTWCGMMRELMPTLEHNHGVLANSDSLAGFRKRLSQHLGREIQRRP